MCQTTISDIDDMEESSASRRKTGRLIEPRKIRKPLMEKKRRARINQSLDELKRIVVDAEKLAGQDLSRVNKLEKADILEMTVKYLKRKSTTTTATPLCGPDVYLAGFQQCIEQVQELLAEQWSAERRQQSGQRMIKHLETCVQQLNILPYKHRLSSSSDDSTRTLSRTIYRVVSQPTDMVVRDSASSSDNDSVQGDEPTVTGVSASITQPLPEHTTQFQDIPPKSMWRPW